MKESNPLPLAFYQNPDVVSVAKNLIGKALYTKIEGELTGGIISETEAYNGAGDKACHAYNNRRTARTETMFMAGGIAYVYLCYGIHHLLNVVTDQADIPKAVLIRAILPRVGIEMMIKRRKKKVLTPNLTTGPGSLAQALGINAKQNGASLQSCEIWIEESSMEPKEILQGPRIGIDYAGEDALLPYRFVANNWLIEHH